MLKSIVLDIQSSLVRGAIVVKDDNGQTHISSVVTKSISNKTKIVNTEHLIKRTIKLVSEVVEHLAKDIQGGSIHNIEYIMSSPWIFSKLKTVRVEYKNETAITPKIVADIVKEELKDSSIKDAEPVEQKVFEIKLNGYPVANFENKKAHLLEISISTSFSSEAFLNKINSAVNRHIHIKGYTFHSALLMQYKALREILSGNNEFLYIHVHSELTDLIIVKDGLCKHIASFPFGINSLLRKVVKETKDSMESGDSLLSLYQGDKLNKTEKSNYQKIINPLIEDWGDQLIKTFDGIFDNNNLPRTVYLSAHSHFDLFKESLVLKSRFNFNVISYESIDTGNKVTFANSAMKSNMMKIYAIALQSNI